MGCWGGRGARQVWAAPADHGLAPGRAVRTAGGDIRGPRQCGGRVCVRGPACLLQVAADGTIGRERAGGRPTVSRVTFTPAEVAGALHERRRGTLGVPALAWRGVWHPAPASAVCLALIIDCKGGLGPIHADAANHLDLSGFTFLGRHNGVSLAGRTEVRDPGQPAYRAFADWLELGFLLAGNPGGKAAGDIPFGRRGDRTHSVGNAVGTGPAVPPGVSATWSGAIWGLLTTHPGRSGPDAFVRGDATVTVSGLREGSGLVVDVAFTGARQETTGEELADRRWSDMPLRADGSFGVSPVSAEAARLSRHPASRRIAGRFDGPDHGEAGGLFGRREVMPGGEAAAGARAEISGAFGARCEGRGNGPAVAAGSPRGTAPSGVRGHGGFPGQGTAVAVIGFETKATAIVVRGRKK